MQTIQVLFSIDYDSGHAPWWIGEGVESWVASQARTLPEIVHEMERIFAAHFMSCREVGNDPCSVPMPIDRVVAFNKAPSTHRAVLYVDDQADYVTATFVKPDGTP